MSFKPGITENEIDSSLIRASTHGITRAVAIDATARYDAGSPDTTIPAGLQLGIVTATGKYKECDPTKSDGTEVPRAILLETVDVADGVDSVASALFHGDVYSLAILSDANLTYMSIAGINFKPGAIGE